MIVKKDLEVIIVDNTRHESDYLAPVFNVIFQGLDNVNDVSTIYTLDIRIKLVDTEDFEKIHVEFGCAGTFDLDKTVCDLNEKDLYECIVASTNEVNKFVTQHNLFSGHQFVPPQRQQFLEVLQDILKKRDCS